MFTTTRAQIKVNHSALGYRAVTAFRFPHAPSQTPIHRILTGKDINSVSPAQKLHQPVLCSQLEVILLKWVRDCKHYNMPVVTDATIRVKAEKIREVLLSHASPTMSTNLCAL
uniref:AlNc14C404G11403 protein n=1 Tax=Albugo laibachii Nc14 TaxID=890382 RepID=F0WYZ3_9STRA|nr:AlNc14C404G11403 [Albugo laibachii Nc14]|eukprot:CCA26707.1 AlNc14C404G11403 [Albugo laibachii Nc14]